MQETQTIPIVFVFIGDPIGSRYAETLARPGKNLTGFANFEAPIGGKWLELLKEVAPQTKRIGFVYHPAASPHREFLEVIRSTASSFGLELTAIPVTSRAEIERDLAAFGGAGSERGIVVALYALTLGASDVITELATRHRLPESMAIAFLPTAAGCCHSASIRRINSGARQGTCVVSSTAKSRATCRFSCRPNMR